MGRIGQPRSSGLVGTVQYETKRASTWKGDWQQTSGDDREVEVV
jgi:hypothetical protein